MSSEVAGEPADAAGPLRVALVGCGWFAVRAHLPALQKLERTSATALGFRVSLYALCSRSAANVERARKRSCMGCVWCACGAAREFAWRPCR